MECLPYTPLLPGYIRLFRINCDTSAPDEGSLEAVSLEAAPRYYALSHSWGTQLQNETIRIDGHVLYVTPDLAAGIRRFRELGAGHCSLSPPIRYMWIDRLCIDQADITERSSQVTLMRTIYSRSIRTLVWLGPDHMSSCAVWRLVDQIYGVLQSLHPDAKTFSDIPVKIYSESSHVASRLPPWNHQLWNHMRQLMELNWFSRIWVVQEVVLSPQAPVIIHGPHLYPWHRLELAVAWLRQNGYMRLPQVPEKLRNVLTMCSLRQSQTRWPLSALISITQIKFHATDQRDKIYGLLGLAAECQDSSEPPEALRPDYSVDVSQTYRKVARFLIENSRSLALLTRAHGTPGSLTRRQRLHDFTGLPSWTPDWSDFRVFNREIRTSLSWIHYSDSKEPAYLGFPQQYTASAGAGLKLYGIENSSVIRVSGIKLGEVTQALPFNQNEMSREEFGALIESRIIAVWDASISTLKGADATVWVARFIKATTAEQHGLIGQVWDQSFKDGLAYLLRLLAVDEPQLALPLAKDDKAKALNLLQGLSVGGEPEKYAVLACTYCFNRCFLVTSTGNIGIGPSDTRVGDCVAVILGGGVPYIIRRRGSEWTFVGESYIEGFMNGEASRACQKGLVQEEILDIA
ncbi:heterokaryon incompatibility protein [Metarhizium robertsii]|uniref:Heterokaryon incompatibility protein n=2 Tax=Metarhizium robertsii TaxID=568076 RepID=A0A0A1UQP6_9HYPO|nr:heterokaryon incompatibility protein [Metarhizium robertsii]